MNKLKRFFEIYDERKLNKDDRRLVFQYVTESALSCASGRMSNAVVLLSITSFLIATFSLFYSIVGELTKEIIIVGITYLLVLFFVIYLYTDSNKKLNTIIKGNIKDQYQLSEVHFDYAKRKTKER